MSNTVLPLHRSAASLGQSPVIGTRQLSTQLHPQLEQRMLQPRRNTLSQVATAQPQQAPQRSQRCVTRQKLWNAQTAQEQHYQTARRSLEQQRMQGQLLEQAQTQQWAQAEARQHVLGFASPKRSARVTPVKQIIYKGAAQPTSPPDVKAQTGFSAPASLNLPAPVPKSTPLQTPVVSKPPTDMELRPGCSVYIDGWRFQIVSPLGMGSYGMVWSGTSDDGREVAIKEILCRSHADLVNAQFESNLLYKLCHTSAKQGYLQLRASHGRVPTLAENGTDPRIPALAAQETQALVPEREWRVRLAMSKIPGTPLVLMLEKYRLERSAGVIDGSSTTVESVLMRLAKPCRFARDLVAQLGPSLDRIASIAYHRDINPRNILVETHEGRPPFYGLVDFGMAVDSVKWRSDSLGVWQNLEVGGDCRYWPVSAWTMFLHGPEKLGPNSPLRQEYHTQLDVHALGITALQVLIEMSALVPEAACSVGSESAASGSEIPATWRALQSAWNQYWEDAADFWSCLIDCFTNRGDWNALKIACHSHGVLDIITKDLVELRSALAEVAAACQPYTANGEAAAVAAELRVLALALREMISAGAGDSMPTFANIQTSLSLPKSNTFGDITCSPRSKMRDTDGQAADPPCVSLSHGGDSSKSLPHTAPQEIASASADSRTSLSNAAGGHVITGAATPTRSTKSTMVSVAAVEPAVRRAPRAILTAASPASKSYEPVAFSDGMQSARVHRLSQPSGMPNTNVPVGPTPDDPMGSIACSNGMRSAPVPRPPQPIARQSTDVPMGPTPSDNHMLSTAFSSGMSSAPMPQTPPFIGTPNTDVSGRLRVVGHASSSGPASPFISASSPSIAGSAASVVSARPVGAGTN